MSDVSALRFSIDGRKSQTVVGGRACGDVAELDHHLWSDVQDLAAAVKSQHGLDCDRMRRIRPVRQPDEQVCIQKVRHYSYISSRPSTESDSETPQFLVSESSFRSHSS